MRVFSVIGPLAYTPCRYVYGIGDEYYTFILNSLGRPCTKGNNRIKAPLHIYLTFFYLTHINSQTVEEKVTP